MAHEQEDVHIGQRHESAWDQVSDIVSSPGAQPLDSHQIMSLQRTIGNQETIRLLQQSGQRQSSTRSDHRVQREDDPKPLKIVSSKAMGRLNKAKDAIEHTKQVFSYGAGNQSEALKATNFNSYYRMKVMRNEKYWKLTKKAKALAAAHPEAYTAAKAQIVHGGNCGEHAQVAFEYLRVMADGETLNRASVKGLDHAFVIIGDIPTETDGDLVVADAWPTKPTAVVWEDFFAHEADRSQIEVRKKMVADGKEIATAIAAGLTLTKKGKKMAEKQMSDKQTDKEIKKGEGGWIWDHENTADEGKDYEYFDV
ncbi:MAG: hypothetical protein AAF125_21090 [Chloroflexota bacterium]